MYFQRTISNEINFSGLGLHTGVFSKVTIKPALADTGIIFVKKNENILINALWDNVVETKLCTVLGKNNVKISTVEHLLSAIRGLKIDNLEIQIEGDEIPVLNGDSYSYVELFKNIQIIEQNKTRRFIQVLKPVSFIEDDRFIFLLPSNDFRITTRINFNNEVIGIQHYDYVDNVRDYVNNISKAKTFGFMNEVTLLKQNGFALGGSILNSIIVDEKGIVNKKYLTYEDEFVRHKTLDIVGDLSLTGNYFLLAHVVAYKSGHYLHNQVLRNLFNDIANYKIVDEPKEIDTRYYRKKVLSLLSA